MDETGKKNKNIVENVFTTLGIKYSNCAIIFIDDNNYFETLNAAVDSIPMLVIKFAFVIVQNWKTYVKILFYMQENKNIHKKTRNPQ